MELADALFYRFELIVRFLIGRGTDTYEVGVLNYGGAQMRDYIAISDQGSSEGGEWKGALQQIPLSDPYFSNPKPPFARLLQLIDKQNSDLETHVLRCAEWTGQALTDLNAASAFVKAAIALEVLFKTNEKGPITPSVMAQIAEGCAFVLGDSPSSAAEVERVVKKLYGVRSAVVHSGKDSVPLSELDALIHICRNVVLALLSDTRFEGIDSVSKLGDYFRQKKYSSVTVDSAAQPSKMSG